MAPRGFGRFARKGRNLLWEFRLNISTHGLVKNIPHPDACCYEPLPYRAIQAILSRMELQENDTFVDIGCGKGRVVCCAARKPIHLALGIEVDEKLWSQAKINLERMRGKRARASVIKAAAQDVSYAEATACYLFNPFGARTLSRVLEGLKASLEESPRHLRICYVHPVHSALIDECSWLGHLADLKPNCRIDLDYTASFWET